MPSTHHSFIIGQQSAVASAAEIVENLGCKKSSIKDLKLSLFKYFFYINLPLFQLFLIIKFIFDFK
jgi:hypothetical protein